MGRVTFRVDDELKSKMNERGEINWSEFIRDSIRQKVSESDHRQIQKLVEEYNNDLPRLFALYMYAERIPTRQIYETIEYLFDEKQDTIVDDVNTDIEQLHLPALYKRAPSGKQYSDIITGEIIDQAGDKIRSYVQNRVTKSSKETGIGISMLPYFIQNRANDDIAFVKQRSLSRTWSTQTDEGIDTDQILSTGLVFADHYSSNAYSYPQYRVPAYAIGLIEDIEHRPTQFDIPSPNPTQSEIEQLKQTDGFKQFMKWLGGTNPSVPERETKNEIKIISEETGLSHNKVLSIRQNMVENNLLLFEYSPNFSSTNSQRFSSSSWEYILTRPGQQLLIEYISA